MFAPGIPSFSQSGKRRKYRTPPCVRRTFLPPIGPLPEDGFVLRVSVVLFQWDLGTRKIGEKEVVCLVDGCVLHTELYGTHISPHPHSAQQR